MSEILDYHIYPHLDLAALFADLQPKDKGKYYLAECPECRKREAFIYKSGKYLKCNRRNNCKYYISCWDYVQQTRNLTNRETLQELARLAGYSLPELKNYSEEELQKTHEKENLLEMSMEYFKSQLSDNPNAVELREYLKQRGYDGHLEAMELGYYPGRQAMESYLTGKGYSRETIQEVFEHLQWRDDYKLVFPYRGPGGQIKSIWGRLARPLEEGEKESRKYLPFTKTNRDTLFGINEIRGQKTVIVVEGYLDARITTAMGIKGVVATGGAGLTEKQIETAWKYGVQNFLLVFDNDSSGYEGTERSIRLLTQKNCRSYVVGLPEGCKDPDELIRKYGLQAFQELLKHHISGARWQARRILGKHDINTDKGRNDCLEEILDFENTLTNVLDCKSVIDTAMEVLEIPSEMLEFSIKKHHEQKAREQLEKDYKSLLRDANTRLQRGDISGLSGYLEQSSQSLRIKYQKNIARPAGSFAARLRTQFKEEEARVAGLLGYNLTIFRKLACNIDGIQPAFYIIGADMRQFIGYARVSTGDQDLAMQIDELKAAGCSQIFTDKVSGAKSERPGLKKCLEKIEPGDTLVVWRLDRLGRSVVHLISVVTELKKRGVAFKSLRDGAIDTSTASGELIFNIFSALAQFERELIRERTQAGLAAARARGKKGGRRQIAPDNPKVRMAKKMHEDRSMGINEICSTLKISRATFYRYVSL